jgi:plastocyanin
MPILRGLAVAALLLAGACGGGTDYGGNPPPPPPPPPAPPPPPPGPTLSVSLTDNQFSPSNGSLLTGGTVTWTWNGAATHNVTFEDGQSNSPNQSTGSHPRTFPTVTAATTFRYRCTFHSTPTFTGMVGQIVVTP